MEFTAENVFFLIRHSSKATRKCFVIGNISSDFRASLVTVGKSWRHFPFSRGNSFSKTLGGAFCCINWLTYLFPASQRSKCRSLTFNFVYVVHQNIKENFQLSQTSNHPVLFSFCLCLPSPDSFSSLAGRTLKVVWIIPLKHLFQAHWEFLNEIGKKS